MYMTASFRTLRTEFALELERLLSEGTSLLKDVDAFLSDFREALAVDPDLPSASPIDRVVLIADSALSSFREVFRSAGRTNLVGCGQDLDELSRVQVSVTSAESIMRQSFRQIMDDWANELSELQAVQDRARKSELRIETRRRAVFESQNAAQIAGMRQEIESQSVQSISAIVSDFRSALKPDEEDEGSDTEDEKPAPGGRRVRSAIARLRRSAESSRMSAISRAQAIDRRLRDSRDDVLSMRNELLDAHQRLCQDALFAARSQAPVAAPPPRRIAFQETSVALDSSELRTPVLDRVKRRLKLLREQRDEELQQSASFLQSVHQDDKRRVRARLDTG
jgi:hypothetical protein